MSLSTGLATGIAVGMASHSIGGGVPDLALAIETTALLLIILWLLRPRE